MINRWFSSIAVPAGKRCINYKAEVFALLTASESIGENTEKFIVFLTDCLSFSSWGTSKSVKTLYLNSR